MAKVGADVTVECELVIRIGRPAFPVSADQLIALERVVSEDEILELTRRVRATCAAFEDEIRGAGAADG